MSSGDINLTVLAALVIAFVVSHAGLVIVARRFNVLLVLATAYLMLSPASGAAELPLNVVAKMARVYVTLLMVFLALTVVRIQSIRPLSVLFLAYIGFFTASAMWSDYPLEASMYKGMYAFVVVAGLFTAYSIRSFDELREAVLMFALAGLLFVVFIMVQVLTNPAAISRIGRLAAWGMIGNRIGQTAAPLLTICAYLALHEPRRLWKVMGYVTGMMLGLIIIYTGSRGAALEALVGCFVVGIPLMRRPLHFAVVVVLFAASAYVAYRHGGADEQATDRFLMTNLESRENPWTEGMRLFEQSPIVGNGWVTHVGEVDKGESTKNFHSMFMQVLVEAGLVGLTLFITLWICILVSAFLILRRLRRMKCPSPLIYLVVALLLAILVHGFFEAGSLIQSLVDSMLLPFCIGLLGLMPALERARLRSMSGAAVPSRRAIMPGGRMPAVL